MPACPLIASSPCSSYRSLVTRTITITSPSSTSVPNPITSRGIALTEAPTTPRSGDPARGPLTNGSSIAPGNTQSHGSLVEAQQRHQPDNLEHPPFKRQRTETVPVTAPTINNEIQQNGNSQTVPHWGRQDVFIQCLANQVFPHVDRELANLPRDKYDVQKIGTKVSMLRVSLVVPICPPFDPYILSVTFPCLTHSSPPGRRDRDWRRLYSRL